MHGRRILIVDDDEVSGHRIALNIRALDHEVVAIVPSDAAAVDRARLAAPDVAMMRAAIPADAEPTTWLAVLRAPWTLPLVVILSEEDEGRLRAATRVEPHGYIVLPCTTRELRASIELALFAFDPVRALRAVHEQDTRFFATAIDLLCVLDFNGYFRQVNPAWERALGFTASELTSRPFIEFVHPDDRVRTLERNARVRGGEAALAFENRYLCKSGGVRWLRWNAAPNSVDRAIYSVARDVTDEKAAHAEREQLVSELQLALAEVNSLRDILPICSYCRRVRDDENYWHTVEAYVGRHTATEFSHGICPSCMATEVEPEFRDPVGSD